MKRLMSLLAALLTTLLLNISLAEAGLPAKPNPEGWRYMGYTPAGVTFLIPENTQSYPLTDADRAAGIIFLGANEEYTIQLRRFAPDVMDLPGFKAILRFTPGAKVEIRDAEGVEIVCYRNGKPTGVSELYGIALTGTDGYMYKVSIFTGVDEDFSEDAPVWDIAEQIADSVSIVDYSDWPLSE